MVAVDVVCRRLVVSAAERCEANSALVLDKWLRRLMHAVINFIKDNALLQFASLRTPLFIWKFNRGLRHQFYPSHRLNTYNAYFFVYRYL